MYNFFMIFMVLKKARSQRAQGVETHPEIIQILTKLCFFMRKSFKINSHYNECEFFIDSKLIILVKISYNSRETMRD